MAFANDPELQELFKGELTERVEALLSGADAIRDGAFTEDLCGVMTREGHTIKGTGKVMGFAAISDAGLLLESTWRRIAQREIEPTARLGEAMWVLASSLPDAIAADPDEGTPELASAMAAMNAAISGDDPRPDPPATEAAPPSREPPVEADPAPVPTPLQDEPSAEPSPQPRPDPPAGLDLPDAGLRSVPTISFDWRPAANQRELAVVPETGSELGGLLGAVETWAAENMVLVNSGRLYEIINEVVSARVDLDEIAALAEGEPIEEGIVERLGALVRRMRDLEAGALELSSVPLREITNPLPQLVGYLARKTGKQIRFELVGDDLNVDRQIVDRIADPLRQLIVNAIEHGVDTTAERERAGKAPTAVIAVHASINDNQLELVVEDDGRGIDWEMVRRAGVRLEMLEPGADPGSEELQALLFAPGLSTAIERSDLVGDGTGLTAVAEAIESLFGSLRLETAEGEGTRIVMSMPTSRALQRALIVEAGRHHWGIPDSAVDAVLPADHVVSRADGRSVVNLQETPLPVSSLAAVFGLPDDAAATQVVVVAGAMGRHAFTVAGVSGPREVATRELGPLLSGAGHLTGAAPLGSGEVVILVDPVRIVEMARSNPTAAGPVSEVLVVDDSRGVRQVVAGVLAVSGFATTVAAGSEEAIAAITQRRPDALVVDFAMPGSDGVKLVERVREQFGSIPIVMLSGVATLDDQARARQAGVDAYFDKSDFREGALVETLTSLIASRSVTGEVVEV